MSLTFAIISSIGVRTKSWVTLDSKTEEVASTTQITKVVTIPRIAAYFVKALISWTATDVVSVKGES